jgi:hypothetical protein
MYAVSDMYASTSSTLVVIGVIGNTQTVRDRERREKEIESERKRESLGNRLFPLESHRHRSVYAFVLCAQLIAQRDRLIDEERNDRHRTYGNLPWRTKQGVYEEWREVGIKSGNEWEARNIGVAHTLPDISISPK